MLDTVLQVTGRSDCGYVCFLCKGGTSEKQITTATTTQTETKHNDTPMTSWKPTCSAAAWEESLLVTWSGSWGLGGRWLGWGLMLWLLFCMFGEITGGNFKFNTGVEKLHAYFKNLVLFQWSVRWVSLKYTYIRWVHSSWERRKIMLCHAREKKKEKQTPTWSPSSGFCCASSCSCSTST